MENASLRPAVTAPLSLDRRAVHAVRAARVFSRLAAAPSAWRVRLAAPSSPARASDVQAGASALSDAGLVVLPHAGVLQDSHAYLNGADEARLDALEQALFTPGADVVWIVRGGYGLTRLLPALAPRLDARLAAGEVPLPVVGSSDVTALLALLLSRGCPAVHGPLVTQLGRAPDGDVSLEATLSTLRAPTAWQPLGTVRALRTAPETPEPQSEQAGRAALVAPVFAANLCVLTHLVGTAAMPKLAGHVVVLEEIGERPYKIDRMLTQLVQSGAFAGVRGVVLGQLLGCDETGPANPARPPVPTAEEVALERLASLGVPVWAGLEAGHGYPNLPLVGGGHVRLTPAGGAHAANLFDMAHLPWPEAGA